MCLVVTTRVWKTAKEETAGFQGEACQVKKRVLKEGLYNLLSTLSLNTELSSTRTVSILLRQEMTGSNTQTVHFCIKHFSIAYYSLPLSGLQISQTCVFTQWF